MYDRIIGDFPAKITVDTPYIYGSGQPYLTYVHIYTYVCMSRVGQNRIYTPFMTVCMVISLPKIPYIHRIYTVLANPMYVCMRICICICKCICVFVCVGLARTEYMHRV